MMQTNHNLPYYLAAAVFFVLLKLGYTLANNDDLAFLLQPTDKLVAFLMDSPSVYVVENGFYHQNLNVVIDKSCSGFNFWVLCFVLFTYLSVQHFNKHMHKILIFPFALLGAYVLTIFVNTSRIFVSIVVQHQTKTIFQNQHMLHETIGILTNLTFLILAYVLLDKFLIHNQHHAKLT